MALLSYVAVLFAMLYSKLPAMLYSKLSAMRTQTSKLNRAPGIPPSLWVAKCHRLEPQVSAEVHKYILKNWPFRSQAVKNKFPGQGLATWHCWNYPDSLDDRIEVGGMLCTLLFVVDDALEYMSLEDGSRLLERLIGVVRKDFPPDPTVPAEWMTNEIWDDLRAIDRPLADAMVEPAIIFWRSQVDPQRLRPQSLGSYFRYREADIASALLLALQRYSLGQHLGTDEMARAAPLEKNYTNCIAIINDVCSYDKEALVAREGHAEGGVLCSAVHVLACESGLPPDMAKRVLWVMVRECERNHERIVAEIMAEGPCSPGLLDYFEGMKAQLSGTEAWSRTTLRYNI